MAENDIYTGIIKPVTREQPVVTSINIKPPELLTVDTVAPVVREQPVLSTINVKQPETYSGVIEQVAREQPQASAIKVEPKVTATNDLSNLNLHIDTTLLDNLDTSLKDVVDTLKGYDEYLTPEKTKEITSEIAAIRPTNEYEGMFKGYLSALSDYVSGGSTVDRQIANQYLQQMDVAAKAAGKSLASMIASTPGLTEGARNLALADLYTQYGTQKSQLALNLAKESRERAFQAALKAAEVSNLAMQFKESQHQFDVNAAAKIVSDKLTLALKEAEIDTRGVELTLDKIRAELSVKTEEMNNRLKASIALLENEREIKRLGLDAEELQLARDQLEATISQNRTTNYSLFANIAGNSIANLWDKKGEAGVTLEDVKNDSLSYNAAVQAYRSLTGDNTAIPPDTWLESLAYQYRPEWVVEKEINDRRIKDVITELRRQGVDETSVSKVENMYRMVAESGGGITISQDGDYVFCDSTGQPIQWIDEEGNAVTFTLGALTGNKTSSVVLSSTIVDNIKNVVGEDKFNTIINSVQGGAEYESFKSAIEEAVKVNNLKNPLTEEEMQKLYNNIKDKKINPTGTGFYTGKIELDTENVFSENNIKLLSTTPENALDVIDLWREELLSNPQKVETKILSAVKDENVKKNLISAATVVTTKDGKIPSSLEENIQVGDIILHNNKLIMCTRVNAADGKKHYITLAEASEVEKMMRKNATGNDHVLRTALGVSDARTQGVPIIPESMSTTDIPIIPESMSTTIGTSGYNPNNLITGRTLY